MIESMVLFFPFAGIIIIISMKLIAMIRQKRLEVCNNEPVVTVQTGIVSAYRPAIFDYYYVYSRNIADI